VGERQIERPNPAAAGARSGSPSAAAATLDALFRDAVAALDAGDVAALARLIDDNPSLVRERLDAPGAWLRDAVDGALDGFFQRPYLLWFVAEDPARAGRLPRNIADIARTIIDAARRRRVPSLHEQLDYALTLVSWSGVAAEGGVQLELIDVLIDAGAAPGRNAENALVNGHFAAAEHLLRRGAEVTLASALLLGRADDAARLAPAADAREKQFALVLAALNGRADAMRRMLELGADPDRPSADLYSHGTPLHHAVCSGSLEAVVVLVEARAKLDARDTAWGATPWGWAEHYVEQHARSERADRYRDIAAYLRDSGGARF
jgi:peptide-methionine (S)-S-oxide reductase